MNSSFIPSDWLPTDKIDGFWEFLKAIDWSEPWLRVLIAFHFFTFIVVILLRNHTNIQGVIFLFLLGLVYASEQLNILGERHWRKFAREQYFDSGGLFISVILSVPVLFNCFVILVSWLWTACSMLIVVGKGRVREKQKQLVKEAKEEEKKKTK
ncbi:transmembrane protein 18 [Nematostella vectensis]|uniref:transmembrane protein 18 n=1 Tax=Nematostella vectensis TaxID=45351 RepID=UPI00207709C8|nr:transmembrane protein 18 [Nematostella vectensis]